jgi:hypothetical protein
MKLIPKYHFKVIHLCLNTYLKSLLKENTAIIGQEKIYGGAGYRSPYLSHAKRALYLSYAPW